MHSHTLGGGLRRRGGDFTSGSVTELLERRRLLSLAYAVTDLGVLGHHDFEYSEGFAINNRGQVGGVSDTNEPFFEDDEGNVFYINHAFRWDEQTGMTDLGEPHTFSVGLNINNGGEVAGAAEIPGVPDPVNGGNAGHPVVWDRAGELHDLGTLPGKVNGTAWGINDRGDAVGSAFNTDPEAEDPVLAPPNAVPFVYDGSAGELRALPLPAGFKNAFAGDVNNRGVVAGYSADSTTLHPFAWVPGPHGSYTPVNLGMPAGFVRGSTRAVSDRGQVAGSLRLAGAAVVTHAFIWTPVPGRGNGYVATDVGGPEGATVTDPRDINTRGEMVGVARIRGRNRAFLYDSTGMHNLNDLIPADSGWLLTAARGINDRGQITGLGLHDGEFHAFVLTPVAPQSAGRGAASAVVATQMTAPPLHPSTTAGKWATSRSGGEDEPESVLA